MKLKGWLLAWIASTGSMAAVAQEYTLRSPDGKTELRISVKDSIRYALSYNGKALLQPAIVGLSTSIAPDGPWKVASTKTSTVSQLLHPVVRQKFATIDDHYDQLQLNFKNRFALQWRAYNNGIAWRWLVNTKGAWQVTNETANFSFQPKDSAWYPVEDGFFSHNERLYHHLAINQIKEKQSLASLPALFSVDGVKILVTETALLNHAGMWLKGDGGNTIHAVFPNYPIKKVATSDRDEHVETRENFIAKKEDAAELPWRIVMIAPEDKDLLVNELPYQLAAPSTGDYSWVKPGKAIWDWWNNNNVYGVDFRAGVNTATYKYYIDFAAKYGLEYVVLDEGWSDTRSLLKVAPDMDMEELSSYAAAKKVGIVLWANWLALDHELDASLNLFSKWGVKGIKVDFMQRDDQQMVNFYERVAQAAAAHKMLVDFHGAHKPAGLQRTYPNVISFEGVYGLEQSKGDDSKSISPEHNVTFPFIRMAAGPADYTPGAMLNAQKDDWAPHWTNPMSMGTRCHQLAMYVVFESPLQMLADNPTHYYKEPECMQFLQAVPTVWDTTLVQQASVGNYILTTRKATNGDWYVGGMTNFSARTLTLDCSFLPEGTYTMHIWKDGINADRNAQDYKMEEITVDRNSKVPVVMNIGGGWAARIVKK